VPPLIRRTPAVLLVILVLVGLAADVESHQRPQRGQRGLRTATPPAPEIPEADRLEARREFNARLRRAHLEMAAGGCKMTVATVTRIAAALLEELRPFATIARMGVSDPSFELNDTRLAACDAEKHGPVPLFERTLEAMVDGRQLDPCAYDPAANYSALLDDPLYFRFTSRFLYDGTDFATVNYGRLVEEGDPRARECFLGIIRAELTGRPWTPQAPLVSGADAAGGAAPINRPAAGRREPVADPAVTAAAEADSDRPRAATSPTLAPRASVVASPAQGVVVQFDETGRAVEIALADGTGAAFLVDEDTTLTDAGGSAHLLLRSAAYLLTAGARVRIQWTATGDQRLARRVTLIATRR
jgi:hypothetical protein